MKERDFPLNTAYRFLRLNGFAKIATEIRKDKPRLGPSGDSRLKRGMALEELTRNFLIEGFISGHWPHGATPEGQSELERLNRSYKLYQESRTLTCEQIKEAVGKYNGGLGARHSLALKAAIEAVQTLSPSLERFLAEVCIVADGGSIPFFPFEGRLVMAEEIETNGWPLLQPVQTRQSDDWDGETNMLLKTVDDLESRTVLLPKLGGGKQLSFLSKYLHFCINDAFPIWDLNARAALGGDDAVTWPAYRQWLKRVRQETVKHKECLEQVRRSGESLVRTLDKALYVIGSEILGADE
jgi:hypothetical protein